MGGWGKTMTPVGWGRGVGAEVQFVRSRDRLILTRLRHSGSHALLLDCPLFPLCTLPSRVPGS